ncbi:MAG: terminase large subunit domain-containing protein [Acidobacteriota bacterium]
MAGRGFGKTRSGAEWVRMQVEGGHARHVALVAPTVADLRNVMIEGESGLLAVSHPDYKPEYKASRNRLSWPNGAVAYGFSADEPERLRGPQHDAAWCDELAAWRYPEAWDMLQFGLSARRRRRARPPRHPRRRGERCGDQSCSRSSDYSRRSRSPAAHRRFLAIVLRSPPTTRISAHARRRS